MTVSDKDEFIGSEPLVSALRKLDADPQLAFVVLPLYQRDGVMQDRFINFSFARMSGREYLTNYVKDDALQHCSIWGIMRVKCVRASGLPRPMNLRQFGLEDSFGIDLDFVFRLATQGDVDFEVEPSVRCSIIAGSTEKVPLTFAYSYFQDAKHVFTELRATKFIEADTERTYVAFKLLLICRGIMVAYRPVHGSELEDETSRLQQHLRVSTHLYLVGQFFSYRIWPNKETRTLVAKTLRLVWQHGNRH